MRRGNRERAWPLALGIVGGLTLATSLLAAFFVRSYEGVLSESFRERSAAYVSAFADAAVGWVGSGQVEVARETARVLLLGTALYVQVVARGEVLLDERAERADRIDLPMLSVIPATRSARLARESAAGPYLDVIIPTRPSGGQAGPGYVRVGIDASSVGLRGRGMALLAGGTAALTDLVAAGLALLALRRARPARQDEAGFVMRGPEPLGRVVERGGLRLEEATKRVTLFGEEVALTPKQHALLALLASEPGRVFSDGEIVAAIWPESPYADSKDVKQQVYLLRRRLAAAHPDGARFVSNAPGFGYRLVPPSVDAGLTET